MGVFNILRWYGKNIKALLLHITIVVKKKSLWDVNCTSHFYSGATFLPERMMDRQTVGIQSYTLEDIVLKINGVCGFKENNWQHLGQSQDPSFEETPFWQLPETWGFSDEINDDVNKCDFFLYSIMKCIKDWKTCITLEIKIFLTHDFT